MGISILLLVVSLNMDPIHLFHIHNILILSLYGIGLAMATTPLANMILSSVPAASAGTGSGLFTTMMYLANVLGVAFISILFTHSLGLSLSDASLADYVRAFSITAGASGLLAFMASICLGLKRYRVERS